MVTERIVLPDFGSHYYDDQGNPHYEVEMKTKPGQMRRANIADAREHGWHPSATGILQMIYRYRLEAYIQNSYILAGARTERLGDEDDLAFCRRIRDEGRAEAIAAAEFGTYLHAAIADAVNGYLDGIEDSDEALGPFVVPFMEWAAKNDLQVIEAERCFCDVAERYGGRIDAIGTLRGESVVIDWQTSATMKTYAEKYAQVCAYRRGAKLEGRPLIVCISSVTPGLIEEHPVEDEAASWDVFADAKRLYYGAAGPWKQAAS